MKLLIAAVALACLPMLPSGGALAQTTTTTADPAPEQGGAECTEELASRKSGELFAILDGDPAKGQNLERYVKEVEEEFGGEPSPDQTCAALDMLIRKVTEGE